MLQYLNAYLFQATLLQLWIWNLIHCYTKPAVRRAEPSMPLLLTIRLPD